MIDPKPSGEAAFTPVIGQDTTPGKLDRREAARVIRRVATE